VNAFREIRGVQQRREGELRRWFQSPFFDLFLTLDAEGDPQWFQLCYARDTWRERVLEWHRGRGFRHLRVTGGTNPARKDAGALEAGGVLPYREVTEAFASGVGLPERLRDFVLDKITEYARPARRFRPPRSRTPEWLRRRRFLDRAQGDR
jgi:hypothetical protein